MNTYLSGQNFIALLLIILGGGFLLQEFDIVDFGSLLSQWWPLAIIAYGLMEFLKPGNRNMGPVIIIAIGALLLFSQLNITDVDFWTLFWPGLLMFVGLSLLFRRPTQGLTAEKSVSLFNIFSGTDKRLNTKGFEGGNVSAVFGGSKLDLRQAEMQKNATLDVFLMFGGIELIVPENVRVINRTMAIFGGAEDKTQANDKATQTLTVTGTVLFGGLEIKN